MKEWIGVLDVIAAAIVLMVAFLLVSPTVCRAVIRRLEIQERASRAYYAVYAQEDAIDRAARKKNAEQLRDTPTQWTKRPTGYAAMFSPSAGNEASGAEGRG